LKNTQIKKSMFNTIISQVKIKENKEYLKEEIKIKENDEDIDLKENIIFVNNYTINVQNNNFINNCNINTDGNEKEMRIDYKEIIKKYLFINLTN